MPATPISRIEPLEARIVPAVSVALTGVSPNFIVTVSDSDTGETNNTLELRLNASLQLEWALNNGSFSNDLDSLTPGIQSATIGNILNVAVSLGSGNDLVTLNNTGGLLDPKGTFSYDGGLGANSFVLLGTSGAETFTVANGGVSLGGQTFSFSSRVGLSVVGGASDIIDLGGGLSLDSDLFVKAPTVKVTSAISSTSLLVIADDLQVNAGIGVGTGAAEFRPFGQGNITLGSKTPGALSLSDAELDRITAAAIVIGPSLSGQLLVTAPITPAGSNFLFLKSGSITSSGGGSIAVPTLALSASNSIALTGSNDVDNLAVDMQNQGGAIRFVDIDDLNIGNTGSINGITGTFNSVVSLTAGGAISQSAGSAILASALQLRGNGSGALNNPDNQVQVLAADLKGPLSLHTSGALIIGAVGASSGIPGTTGVTTSNSPITLETTAGNITVFQKIDAGIGTVDVHAGGPAGTSSLTIGGAGSITGKSGITLEADYMGINSFVDAGTAVAAIRPAHTGIGIALGGNDSPTELGLSDSELDLITAGMLRIGRADSVPGAGITVRGSITGAGGLYGSTLSLITGGAVTDDPSGKLSLNALAISAAGIVNLDNGLHQILNLAGNSSANAPIAFTLQNSTALTIGGPIDGIWGITTTNPAAGGIVLGSPTFGATVTVAKPIVTQNGQIVLGFDDMNINAAITPGGDAGYVQLAPGTLNQVITVGTGAGTLQLSPTELDFVNSPALVLGNGTTGNIVLAAPITRPNTSSLTLWSGNGALLDGTPDEALLVSVGALGVRTGAGAGLSGGAPDIDIAVGFLAFTNSGGGIVSFENTGSLTIGGAGGINGGTSTAAGQDILLDVHGALTVTAEIHSAGSIILHTIDTAAGDESITIAPGGAIYATSFVHLQSGDNVTAAPGAAIVTTGTTLQISVDAQSADPGVGGTFSSGAYMQVAGTVVLNGGPDNDTLAIATTAATSWGLVIDAGAGSDSFTLIDGRNSAGARVTFDPVSNDSGNVGAAPGDVLLGGTNSLFYTGLEDFVFKAGPGSDTFFVTPAPGDGTRLTIDADAPTTNYPGDTLHLNLVNFSSAKHNVFGLGKGEISGPGLGTVSFTGIETQTGALPTVVDLARLADGNDNSADFINVRRVVFAGTNMTEVSVNNALILRTAEENVSSLAVIGSGDSDFLTISETTAGLPHFVDAASGSHTNVAFLASEPTPAFTGLEFTGAGGYNSVIVNLSSARSVGLYPDTTFVDSGVASFVGALAMSYRNVGDFHLDGAGGTLTYDASPTGAVTSLTLLDGGIAGDGVNQLNSDAGLQATVFSGFRNLIVTGGIGAQEFSVNSLDSGTNAKGITLKSVTFDGGDIFGVDVSADTFTVSGIPSVVDVTLIGRAGNDVFNIGQQAGGTIHILGGTGTDRVSFANAGGGLTLDLTLLGVAQLGSGGAVEFVDAPEAFSGSGYADRLHIGGGAVAQSIIGGGGTDTLTIDAHDHFTKVRRTSLTDGTVTIPGFKGISFSSVEKVAFTNSGSSFGSSTDGTNLFGSATAYTVGKGPVVVASADMNSDGILDLVTANGKGNSVSVLLGLGNGTFSTPTQVVTGGKNPIDVILADIDQDNLMDMVVLNSGSSSISILKGFGTGAFAEPKVTATIPKPTAFALGRIDGDSLLDAVVVNGAGKMSLLPQGTGAGFGPAVTLSSGGKGAVDVAIGDFTGDGNADIAVLHAKSNALTLHRGDGTGQFSGTPENTKILAKATELAIADFNNDGVADVAVSYSGSRFLSVLLGGTPSSPTGFANQFRIATPSAYAARTLAVGDLDGDGNTDLVMASANGAAVRVLLGSGTGLFGATRSIDLGPDPARIASFLELADLNNDGALDIALAQDKAGEASVLLRTPAA